MYCFDGFVFVSYVRTVVTVSVVKLVLSFTLTISDRGMTDAMIFFYVLILQHYYLYKTYKL